MCSSLFAQDDFGIWQKINFNKPVSSKFGAQFIYEHRMKNNARDLDVALIMPGVWYKPVSWVTMGFIYDYAITKTATRHVILPYVNLAKGLGDFTLSWREMGQYNITSDAFLLRTSLSVKYHVPGTIFSPFVQIEPYMNLNDSYSGAYTNPLLNAACAAGVSKATNFFGVSFPMFGNTTFDVGYNYYFLGAQAPGRHLLNFNCTIRL